MCVRVCKELTVGRCPREGQADGSVSVLAGHRAEGLHAQVPHALWPGPAVRSRQLCGLTVAVWSDQRQSKPLKLG